MMFRLHQPMHLQKSTHHRHRKANRCTRLSNRSRSNRIRLHPIRRHKSANCHRHTEWTDNTASRRCTSLDRQTADNSSCPHSCRKLDPGNRTADAFPTPYRSKPPPPPDTAPTPSAAAHPTALADPQAPAPLPDPLDLLNLLRRLVPQDRAHLAAPVHLVDRQVPWGRLIR